ncbi:hypothetical protein [Nostoc sp.]|uniref:hypothetical protein n=1 Tax=Nostoc sp. TaxID=1180 RepID=UPI002FF6210D
MSDSRKEIRICFIGESFVNGTGDPEFLGWTGRVCRNAESRGYAITHYNLGVRAETSRFLKQRWYSEVSYRLPRESDGRVSQEFALVCDQLDVPYLDVFSSLVKSPIWLAEAKANDGAHPKADGYAEFAAIVQNWEGWLNWFTP